MTANEIKPSATSREIIIRNEISPSGALAPGVSLQLFASGNCGAEGFCTGLATFSPRAALPYHMHGFSEAVTVVEGQAAIVVEGRVHHLDRLDCVHIPKGHPHQTRNASTVNPLRLLVTFAASLPAAELVDGTGFSEIDLGREQPETPEHIQRFAVAEKYELAAGTRFFDLFSGQMGAEGICGGYGEFAPGASLPCHVHDFGESITIVAGEARCEVEGRSYGVSGYDTAFIPQERPHRFLNETGKTMAMIWVYGGSEPTRTLVETGYCTGALVREGDLM